MGFVHHFQYSQDFAPTARTFVENHLLERSASLRAGLRRKEGDRFFRYPALMRHPRRNRLGCLNVLGYSISDLSKLVFEKGEKSI